MATKSVKVVPADPTKLIQNIADVIERRRKGESIEAAALAVFKVETPQQPTQPEMAPPGPQGPVEQAPTSPAVPGQPSGGATQQPPQGQPQDLQSILSGLGR